MKMRKLVFLVLCASVVLSSFTARGRAQPMIVTKLFVVQPGKQVLHFSTGAPAPLLNLRFAILGRPDVLTDAIQGLQNNSPNIDFNPPATPLEVTIFFLQHPIQQSPSADFSFSVTNQSNNPALVFISAIGNVNVFFQHFIVQPGEQSIHISTGGQPPLADLRFVTIGPPDLTTSRIADVSNAVDITFNPPATPLEVTIFFLQHPIQSPTGDFGFSVTNHSHEPVGYFIGAIWQ